MATTSNLFEIRRQGLEDPISGTLPASTAQVVGKAMRISGKDADTGVNTFILANGRSDGFLTREVRTTAGLTAEELQFGLNNYTTSGGSTGEAATPFEAGKAGVIEQAEELEVEGSDYILGSATPAITTSTAVDTLLSFDQGRFCVAQSGQWAEFRLVKQMTPLVQGNTRIYVKKVVSHKVA